MFFDWFERKPAQAPAPLVLTPGVPGTAAPVETAPARGRGVEPCVNTLLRTTARIVRLERKIVQCDRRKERGVLTAARHASVVAETRQAIEDELFMSLAAARWLEQRIRPAIDESKRQVRSLELELAAADGTPKQARLIDRIARMRERLENRERAAEMIPPILAHAVESNMLATQ